MLGLQLGLTALWGIVCASGSNLPNSTAVFGTHGVPYTTIFRALPQAHLR